MDCTVTLLHAGKSTVQPLRAAWGNKFANSFKTTINGQPERVRVVVAVDGRKVSGFIQVRQDKIGLPEQRLSKTAAGFGTYWPEAGGIKVGINVSGDDLAIQEVIRPQAKQFWGVFKNATDCKCRTIGPKDTKPTPPEGFRSFGSYTNQPSADRGQSKCEKSLPKKCKDKGTGGGTGGGGGGGTTDVQWYGIFKDPNNCQCQSVGPTPQKPPIPSGLALFRYYNDQALASAGAVQCQAEMDVLQNCSQRQGSYKGILTLRPRVAGLYTIADGKHNIDIPVEGAFFQGYFPVAGQLNGSRPEFRALQNEFLAASLEIRDLNVGGVLVLGPNTDNLQLPVVALDYQGSDPLGTVYGASWYRLTLKYMGVFDLTLKVVKS